MSIYTELSKEMEVRSEEIEKDINNYVALYNIKNRKAFFFMTNEEARHAIKYITSKRMNIHTGIWAEERKLADKLINGVDRTGFIHCGFIPNRSESSIRSKEFSMLQLSKLFAEMESKNKTVSCIIMNSNFFGQYIRSLGKNSWEPATISEATEQNIVGTIYGSAIRICNNLWNSRIIIASLINREQDNEIIITDFEDILKTRKV